jgi:hypothetical protein
MKIIKLSLLLACSLMIMLSACVKNATVEEDHSIKLTFDTITITQGVTQYLAAKNYHANQINWSSSDTSIVKIDSTGLINAVKPGQVTITAVSKLYAVSAKCIVTVVGDDLSETKVSDVAAGADGSIFAIGIDVVSPTGGFGIYKLAGNKLNKIPYCAGVRIAVAPNGKPWVVNKSHLIFRYRDSTSYWETMPGTATDIAVGADGSVFALSTEEVSPSGGYSIMKWNVDHWDVLPGCAGVRIAVDAHGTPWVVNKSNIVFRCGGSYLWDTISGVAANDIGIGADGSVYVTGQEDAAPIYKFISTTTSWSVVPDLSGTNISVTPTGQPVYIDKSGVLHKP